MSFPKKKTRRRGRIAREKYKRRLERERQAAEEAARTGSTIPQGRDPQLNAGIAAGPNAGIPSQDAQGGPGRRGGGAGVSEPAQTSPNATQGQPEAHETPLFERRDNIRADANMMRRALRLEWLDRAPKPEHTEAVLTKGTMQALQEDAKPHEVLAIAKLHLDYHSRVLSHEHHQDRMEYYRQALALREKDAGLPGGAGMEMETTGPAKVTVYLPNNRRAEVMDELRPEDLLKDDDE